MRHERKRANLDSVQTSGSNAFRTNVRPHRRPAPVPVHVGRWPTGKNPENSERSIRGVGGWATDEAVQNGGTIENALMARCEISN